MATKSKNKRWLIAWVLLVFFGAVNVLTAFSVVQEYFFKDYWQTEYFQETYYQFLQDLVIFELNHPDPSTIAKQPVTDQDIHNYRYRNGDLPTQLTHISSKYDEKINKANLNHDEEVAEFYKKERDDQIKNIKKEFSDDAYVRSQIKQDRQKSLSSYYKEENSEFREDFNVHNRNFNYYFENLDTGKIYTNLPSNKAPGAFNKKKMLYDHYYSNLDTKGYADTSNKTVNEVLDGTADKYSGHIFIPKSASSSNAYVSGYQEFKVIKTVLVVMFISGIVFLIAAGVLNHKKQLLKHLVVKRLEVLYGKVPIDVRAVVLAVTGLSILSYFYVALKGEIRLESDTIFAAFAATAAACLIILFFLQTHWCLETVKDGSRFRHSLRESAVVRLKQTAEKTFSTLSLSWKILVILVAVFGLGMSAPLLTLFFSSFWPSLFFLACAGVPLLLFIFKRVDFFNVIVGNILETAEGLDRPDLPVHGYAVLDQLAKSLNTLKHGVKRSQREQAKSERLKTELITNVSHDLRTPLTSIITYSELLKKPDLAEDDRRAYLQIIDRKSKRLKRLIDDLFEASKMASGSVKLNKEKVSLVELMAQALAEHDETIQASSLQFRVKKPDSPLYTMVDGKKMWRVFDNLIGNILKYSLENTRVYISLENMGEQAIIVFKNITKYELGADVDELFERFKRGDASRHTEGSGLGLAIAKSIVDLHSGTFDIHLDGDLFKITIKLDI